MSDDRKKQLEIGGGLVAGIAAIGAGYYAYHEHHKSEEQVSLERISYIIDLIQLVDHRKRGTPSQFLTGLRRPRPDAMIFTNMAQGHPLLG